MSLPKLLQVTAADVMQKHVVTISQDETLREALQLMTENHVGGLPVVDQGSRCIGLVSATDILNYEQEHTQEVEEGNADAARYYDRETERWETVRLTAFALEQFSTVRVSEVMAVDLISVEAETPIKRVAETMEQAGVHRVLVLDPRQQLLGIIAASDFVRLIARA